MSDIYGKNPRNTMGIIDKNTGERYKDILSAHLQLRRLCLEEWLVDRNIAESKDRQKSYKILLDFATQRELLREGIINAIVSFQKRTDGNFAVVRLYDTNKINKINKIGEIS